MSKYYNLLIPDVRNPQISPENIFQHIEGPFMALLRKECSLQNFKLYYIHIILRTCRLTICADVAFLHLSFIGVLSFMAKTHLDNRRYGS